MEVFVKQTMSLILLMVIFVSCGKGSSGGEQNQVENKPIIKEEASDDETTVNTATLSYTFKRYIELESDLSNIDKFKKYINTYIIQAQAMTGHYQNSQLVCSKLIFNQRKNEQKTWFDTQGQSATMIVEISQTDPSEVIFNCYIQSADQHVEVANLKALKSYIISNENSLAYSRIADSEKIGTLILDENTTLSTEGRDVSLEVKELISLKGAITTFGTENFQQKKFDVDGESGGNLNLKIQKAIGELNIQMKGRPGGEVTLVRTQKSAPAADPALNGRCSGYHDRGNRACVGKAGAKGFDGEPGYDGKKGGNTGKLHLIINKKENLKLSVDFIPGEGSKAIPDTKPTPGQPGGVGSHIQWHEPCGRNDHGGGGGGGGGRSFIAIPRSVAQCGTLRYKFPDGAQGSAGNPVPKELQARDGADGEVEVAIIDFINDEIKLEINQNWKNF